jgi:RNA recognition motif-containing protein
MTILNDFVSINLLKPSMIVLLRNIPPETMYEDIINFIEPALKAKWFGKDGYIEEVKILSINDNVKETVEQHGIIRINPDSSAKKAIKFLNRKPILGKRIAVREYRYRSWHNDPRGNLNKRLGKILHRRTGSRRRPNLKSVLANATTFTSDKSFHKIYS